jgi:hypothetical protein
MRKLELPVPKKKGEAFPYRVLYIRTDPALDEVLRRHAFERDVPKSTFCEDILRMVVLAITDPNDPTFMPSKMGVKMPNPVPERYPGYRETLGIVADTDADANSHLSPLPAQPSDNALL